MIFTESRFLIFFAVAFCVYWVLPRNRPRKICLLALSYVFYASWDWRFLWLILISTGVDYVAGLWLERAAESGPRKRLVALSLVVNLGFLWWFKYYNFFVDAGVGLLDLLGWEGDRERLHLNIILPVGISFYTFQTLSYTIDVYRRKMRAVSSFLDFALFVTFFPQLVAGPIVRATHFIPQLAAKKLFRDVNVRACLTLFFFGFFKKAVVSDNIAPITDQVFADPGLHDTLSNWIAVLMWHVQEYCDFSGYSDMAIATAGLLGYELPLNFNFPYFARNISDFWRRWHITLSTWFRDYLYVTIGGSKGGVYRGIMTGCVTMLLVGVWHGAGWQHAGFGLLMCGAIIVARLWSEWVPKGSRLRRTATLLGPLLINYFLFINWIVFRAESWDKCMDQFRIFFFLGGAGPQSVDPRWILLFVAFAAVQIVLFYRLYPKAITRLNDYAWAAVIGGATALVLVLMATDYQPFVYFHF
ncbi:MAG: MBOAT family O-acyltransferase [Planctomycetota bacterium]